MKKRVLVLNGQYAPGYKGGGPIQSCMCWQAMQNEL